VLLINGESHTLTEEGDSIILTTNAGKKEEIKLVSFDIEKVKLSGNCISNTENSQGTNSPEIKLNQQAVICGRQVVVKKLILKNKLK